MSTMKGKNGGTLNRWDKGVSGNPNGRPRKLVSTLKGDGFTKGQVEDCLRVMLSLTLDELKEVFTDEGATVLEKTIARALSKDITAGRMDTVEALLNRTYGKPVTHTEVTGNAPALFAPVSIVVKDSETRSALERLSGAGDTDA